MVELLLNDKRGCRSAQHFIGASADESMFSDTLCCNILLEEWINTC